MKEEFLRCFASCVFDYFMMIYLEKFEDEPPDNSEIYLLAAKFVLEFRKEELMEELSEKNITEEWIKENDAFTKVVTDWKFYGEARMYEYACK